MYGAYSHTVHQENVRICEPKAMHSSILAACDSILARYLEVFLWIFNPLSLISNDIKHTLNTAPTEEQTHITTVTQ